MATATRVGWRPSVRMVALTSRASAYTPEDRAHTTGEAAVGDLRVAWSITQLHRSYQ